jgi:hypothetical protein
MLIAYLTVSSILGLFFTVIWSRKTWANAIIKVALMCWTLWSLLLLAVGVFPLIDLGSVKLF